jgi:hypothetical protein
MFFKTRPGINKQFDTAYDFGFKNLIVSGCSFTFNNHESIAISWPYYLRDMGGFDQVFDCSMPGAGNYHISNSLIWGLENDRPDPKNSLVIVMWSGNDRDDYIGPVSQDNGYFPFKFHYSEKTISGITGGSNPVARGNTPDLFKKFTLCKTLESRAIENYLYISHTWHYLKSSGFKFMFLEFLKSDLPSRTSHFDIKQYLPVNVGKKLDSMMENITDPYTWALKHNLLASDDFHPSPDGQLSWSKNVLCPHMSQRRFDFSQT